MPWRRVLLTTHLWAGFAAAPVLALVLASVPIAILYNFFADRFVAGFTVGAVK